MIFGIGCDIVECNRFEDWIHDIKKCQRFFNQEELFDDKWSDKIKIQHLASRYACKEAFVKALGTGFSDFQLTDIFLSQDSSGKPILNVSNQAKKLLDSKISDYNIHVTLSHENSCAIAFVVIESK
ncbi:MAG: holo-ACP synthase [Treponema sp.]|nr:holo-ACP synthase [Treponema sp.]